MGLSGLKKTMVYVFWQIAYNRFIEEAAGNLQLSNVKKFYLQSAEKLAALGSYTEEMLQCL